MSNYKEVIEEMTGIKKSWVRSNQVTIYNHYNSIPKIVFNEEKITNYPDGRVEHTPNGRLSESLIDPTIEFELLNPENDEVIGIFTHRDLYILLYSLYISLAKKRDNI